MRFCGFNCKYASACKDVPSCMTYNPIYCKLKKTMVEKGMICDEDMVHS
jgi:hypothetical protein